MTISLLYFGTAIGVGVLLGVSFVVLWRLAVPRGATRRTFSGLTDITRRLAKVDEPAEFLSLYRRLVGAVGGYLVRNILGLIIGGLPVAFIFLFVAQSAIDSWDGRGGPLEVYPSVSSAVQNELSIDQLYSEVDGSFRRTAFCWSRLTCIQFELLGFRVEELEQAPAKVPYLVVRARYEDEELFWPILSDFEALFFASFTIATLITFLLPARHR